MSLVDMFLQALQIPKVWICHGLEVTGVACANCGDVAMRGAARSIYYFGLYAVGLATFMFAIGRTRIGARVRKVIGLPEEPEPWLDLFCATLFLIGILYLIAAVANLGPVFWAMVVGRLVIGFTCIWFVLHDHFVNERSRWKGSFTPQGIGAAVILIALPDVISAMITAGHLLSDPLPLPLASSLLTVAGNWTPLFVFAIGVSDVVSGMLILAFPRVIQELALFHETPQEAGVEPSAESDVDPHLRRWAGVFAVLLMAIGGYEIVAAVNGYLPYFWATIIVNILFFAVSILICLFRKLPDGKRSWPLLIYGAFEFVLALAAWKNLSDLR